MLRLHKNKSVLKRESGSVLIIAIIMTGLFLAIGMTISRISVLERKNSTEVAYSAVAYQQAEIGMEIALNQIYKPNTADCSGCDTLETFLNSVRPSGNPDFHCQNDFITYDDPVVSGASFRIATYTRPANPGDAPATCDSFGGVAPRRAIGRVKVWGMYKGALRSVETQIIDETLP